MDLSLGTFIGQAGTFLVLVLVTMKFVWPPLTQAMEERRQKIAEGLAQSDEAEKALAKAEAEAEKGRDPSPLQRAGLSDVEPCNVGPRRVAAEVSDG
ncbi:MAG: hypothetical protein ACPGJE_07840, partial [Wenzhouxiangellaceae bacterium]